MDDQEYHDYGKRVTSPINEQQLFALLAPITLLDDSVGAELRPSASTVLAQLGFSKPKIRHWVEASQQNGSSVDDEILMENFVEEEAFYAAIARHLRLPFCAVIDERHIHYQATMDRQLTTPRILRIYPSSSPSKILIVPELGRLKALSAFIERNPYFKDSVSVTTRSAIRQATWAAGANDRTRRAITELSEVHPEFSARTIVNGQQGFTIGLCLSAFAAALINPSLSILVVVHIFCSGFYLLSNLLRLMALLPRFRRPFTREQRLPANAILPVYSILVPLHKEGEVLPQLIAGLNAIEWPRSRLDIKLICESDDEETLTSLKSLTLGREYEVVRVPPSQPRTKPKALQYALPSVRGQFVTVYDAEDRPHPQQVIEAYRKFYHGPEALACLQAPLVIANISQSWISALFAIEYSVLFRRILPMLAAHGLPVPLGGTSNHFKTAALRDVGAWDPYNVTEDADLGMRLSRAGYSIDMIGFGTLEDAPVDPSIWMNQRIRWYKGWLVTWLVMMRTPIKTMQQLRFLPFMAAQLTIGGMLLSSLCHPFMLSYIILTLGALLTQGAAEIPNYRLGLMGFDALNIVGSYAIFLLILQTAMRPSEQVNLGPRWTLTPIYWMMLSIAAWRSVFELKKAPFRWNKTPHKPSKSAHSNPI